MHKLIRQYLDEKIESLKKRFFRRKFVDFYSNYLKQLLKRRYGQSEPLNDKEDFTIKYLERLNIDHFQTVLSKIKNDPLEVDKVLAVSYLIQEDLLISDPHVAEWILSVAHDSYKELSMFKTVCAYFSDSICATILWKVFVNIGACSCATEAHTLYQDKDFCDSLLECQNLIAFKHQNTLDLIRKSVADSNYARTFDNNIQRLLFEKLEEKVHDCKLLSWYLLLLIFGILCAIQLLYFIYRASCTRWNLKFLGSLILYIVLNLLVAKPTGNAAVKVLMYFDDRYVSQSVDTNLAY